MKVTIIKGLFTRNFSRYEGVPNINIYLLRLLFILVVLFLATGAWSHIFNHEGEWKATDASAWCMWAAYSLMCLIGIIHPLKMLPIVLFEIIYKITWLLVVAWPLWRTGELTGSAVEGMANDYTWVILPVLAMPWKYFFRKFILGRSLKLAASGE
jgi:hypothetical protein